MVPSPDGRQSDTAAAIQRGVGRLLRTQGFAIVYELPLATGRRADVVALGPRGDIWITEIKSSVADFRTDGKWPEYRLSCDRLFFATCAAVPLDIFPDDTGLILADAYSGELVREAPEHRLPAATRKAMMMRFGQAAAIRLHGLIDPGAGGVEF
ncbi:MmcB family DNA repair protein [Bauldia sp.]|uniref:MmcB family DNA repair protein n=1 Tax=Bauldia sp. TaxID=2575872 RepID=UPI003BACFEB4